MSITDANPFWSVMIPTYNPRQDYLEKAIRSVLEQDPGPERMQIEVVDDCSTKVDVASMVNGIAGERVGYFQNPTNLGLAGCWNACIVRAKGVWVHILHQDDEVMPGFYERLKQAAVAYPEATLIATRAFVVNGQGIIDFVTPRHPRLERFGHEVVDLFYGAPFQCPGVVVRREFYEAHGGFRTDLCYTLDCEMWARAISLGGGILLPDVLAVYRTSEGNESERMLRSAEAWEDTARLSKIFAEQYPEFDIESVSQHISRQALAHAEGFARKGDREAAQANLRYWQKHTPLSRRFRRAVSISLRRLLG